MTPTGVGWLVAGGGRYDGYAGFRVKRRPNIASMPGAP